MGRGRGGGGGGACYIVDASPETRAGTVTTARDEHEIGAVVFLPLGLTSSTCIGVWNPALYLSVRRFVLLFLRVSRACVVSI